MSVIDLVRADLRALQPYSSARTEVPAQASTTSPPVGAADTVFLNANESPWPAVVAGSGALNRYPDPQPAELLQRLASLYGVATTQLLAGRGSDEAIDLLVRAFCRAEHDAIALAPPTFGMYAVSAAIQGAAVVEAPLLGDFSLDIDGLLARMTPAVKLVFVCSPNNPTGSVTPLSAIERLAADLTDRALVVVDEAYIEFAAVPSAIALLDRHDNVAVLRTLSKAHALAAARIGALVAHADVVSLLRRLLPAYPLPLPCIEAALAALSPASLAATRVRAAARAGARAQLVSVLRQSPHVLEIFPSSANFVLVRSDDAPRMYRRLLDAGIVVRDVSRHVPQCLRVSVGSDEDHRRLAAALARREAAA